MTSRFALLIHDLPELHLDLMLCREEVLWTWRLKRWPDPAVWVAAERIADHRSAYLDFEGPIALGRGEVRRLLGGTFEWEVQADETLETLEKIRLKAHYAGRSSIWELHQNREQGAQTGQVGGNWRFRRSM